MSAVVLLIVGLVFVASRGLGGTQLTRQGGVWIGRLLVLLFALAFLVFGRAWLAVFVLAAGVLPRYFACHVLAPLGVPYVGYWFFRMVHLGMGEVDAVFYELSARVRSGLLLSPKRLAWLERKLDEKLPLAFESDTGFLGGGLTSRAMLDALQGRRDSARELFLIAQSLPDKIAAPGSRELSQSWLLADATSRGDFGEVLRLSTEGPSTITRAFFRYVALHYLGYELSPFARLASSCASVLQGNIAAFRLHRLARRVQVPGPLQSAAEFASAKRVLLTAVSMPRGSVTRDELRELASTLQELEQSGAILQEVRRVAGSSGHDTAVSFDAERASEELLDELVDVLEDLWRHSPPERSPPEETNDLVLRFQDRMEHLAQSQLRRLVDGLPDTQAKNYPPLEDNWRAWARIRALLRETSYLMPAQYERVLVAVRHELISYAACVFNDNDSKVLGYEMFVWLRDNTPETDDNYELVRKNTRLARKHL